MAKPKKAAKRKKRVSKQLAKPKNASHKAKAKKKTKSKPMSNQSTGKKPPGQSVDQIRDIIFGQQMADYDDRFAKLESDLRAEVAELKKNLTEELRQSVADLRELIQKEKAESNDRNVARRQLGDKLQKLADDLRK